MIRVSKYRRQLCSKLRDIKRKYYGARMLGFKSQALPWPVQPRWLGVLPYIARLPGCSEHMPGFQVESLVGVCVWGEVVLLQEETIDVMHP